MGIKIAKNDNAIFCAIRYTINLIYFGKGHGREGIADDWTEELVLVFCDVFPGLGIDMETEVFFEVSLVPYCFVDR